MNSTEKTELFEKAKEEGNYFQLFDFSKFKRLLVTLTIVALLLIIKQFITNNFHTLHNGGNGIMGILQSYTGQEDLPVWAKTVNTIIVILMILVLLSWEAIYEKKYDKIKIVLLVGLPSIAMNLIATYSDLYQSFDKSSFFVLYSILGYFHFYPLYGLLRGKILYGKKLSFMGFIIGFITIVSLSPLYEKLPFIFTIRDSFTPLYTYGMVLTSLFIPMSVFYFLFLSDAGFSFKNFVKMPAAVFVNKANFTAHFLFLFTSFINILFYIQVKYSFDSSWYNSSNTSIGSVIYDFFNFSRIIFLIAIVYLVFSQLLLVQLGALRRRPLWIYLISFMPIVNLLPLFFFYRTSTPLTNLEYFEIQEREDRNRLSLRIFILLLTTLLSMYLASRSGLGNQDYYFIVGAIVIMYSLILFSRIGIWIILGIIGISGIAAILFLRQNISAIFYYFGVLFYVAISLYNLHVAVFWEAKEWDDIAEDRKQEENVEV